MPTLLNMMSSRPNCSTATATVAATSASFDDVARDRDGRAARALDLTHGLFGAIAVHVGADHAGALFGEAQSRRPAHARTTPGDNGRLALELHEKNPFDRQAVASTGGAAGVNL